MVRRGGNKPARNLWIFCEGKTEKYYFDKLKFVERIRRIRIRPKQSGNKSADGVIQEALDFIKKSRDFEEGDLVACLFDRDSNNNRQLTKAKSLAESNNILISFSNPCFEYWIVCHYGYFPSSCERPEIVAKIKEKLGEFSKTDTELYNKTKDKITGAKANAKRQKDKMVQQGNELLKRETNPLTLVFELIEVIEQFKD